MVDFIFILALYVFCLVIAVFFIWQKSKKAPTVPGHKPTSERVGNFSDIIKAGSLHEFLLDLHKQFGPIASFWFGKIYTISIASAELFKEHKHVFDRPLVLFGQFRTLIDHSVQFANNDDGRARRRLYDKGLTPTAIKRYYCQFHEVADDIANSWNTMLNEQHVPLSQYMSMLALKAVLQALFVNIMKDDKDVLEFKRKYDQVMAEMERRATDPEPPTEARETVLQEGKKYFQQITQKAVNDRKAHPPDPGEEMLLDLIIEYTNDDAIQFADALTFTIGGAHTTGSLLTWAIYYIATHPELDKKMYEEIKAVLGDKDVDHTTIGDLVYIRQVIDETLRIAVISPVAARFQDVESNLGGYKIPKNTPVVHALGVGCKDENVWPLPDSFDPDRFSKEQLSHRSRFWFSPFGFAGKRMCPGQHFAYAEVTVALVTLLRKFKVHLVEGQDVTPVYDIVSHTKDEVWITLSKR